VKHVSMTHPRLEASCCYVGVAPSHVARVGVKTKTKLSIFRIRVVRAIGLLAHGHRQKYPGNLVVGEEPGRSLDIELYEIRSRISTLQMRHEKHPQCHQHHPKLIESVRLNTISPQAQHTPMLNTYRQHSMQTTLADWPMVKQGGANERQHIVQL
jgi:hypothetical protein